MPGHVIYFLHGFAGGPEDWDEVIAHLPKYNCQALSYPFALPTEGILVGYSMGGRIALESKLPKIIISSNPSASQEGSGEWIKKLQTGSIKEFFKIWYTQPLFTTLKINPNFTKIMERRLKQDREVLIDQLRSHPSKDLPKEAHFIHGEFDMKYRELYAHLKIPSHEIPGAGHACHLEKPVETARQIKILIDAFNL